MLEIWVQWNHLNLDRAFHYEKELCSYPSSLSCLLSSHCMSHAVRGLWFNLFYDNFIHIYTNFKSHSPCLFHLPTLSPFLETSLNTLVSLFHFVLVLWLTELNLGVSWAQMWRNPLKHDDHMIADNDCHYSNHELEDRLGSLSSTGWGRFRSCFHYNSVGEEAKALREVPPVVWQE